MTLVEMMLGASILAVGLTAVLQGFIACSGLNEASKNLVVAAGDAQFVLEQIKSLDYQTCIANNFSTAYTLPVFSNLKSESVAFDPAPVIGPNISKITVKVSWMEKQTPRSYSLATYFAK